MINVTVTAASKISELLAEENKGNAGLRVFVQGGGCSGFQYGLMIDEGEGDATTDAVIESNGVKLLVDPISARYLRGAEVDFVDNVTGGGFTIKNPNAKSTSIFIRPLPTARCRRRSWSSAPARPSSRSSPLPITTRLPARAPRAVRRPRRVSNSSLASKSAPSL